MILLPPLAVAVLERDEEFFGKKKYPALHLFTGLPGDSNSTITAPAAQEEKMISTLTIFGREQKLFSQ